jgi:hypothetical protein
MRIFAHKRLAAFGLAAIMVVALAGGALAYWTITGSGAGTASAGAPATPITVNQTTTLQPMYPGDTAQTLSGNFTNTNAGPVYVNTVTASIASVTKAVGAPAGTCDATDFTLASPVMTVNAQVPVGSPELTVTWTGASIQFNNKAAANQDGCQGATVALGYSIP